MQAAQASSTRRITEAIELWAEIVGGKKPVATVTDGQLDFLQRNLPAQHESREPCEPGNPDSATRLEQVRCFRDAAASEMERRAERGRLVRLHLDGGAVMTSTEAEVREAQSIWADIVSGKLLLVHVTDEQVKFLYRHLPENHAAWLPLEQGDPDAQPWIEILRERRVNDLAERKERAARGQEVLAKLDASYQTGRGHVFVPARKPAEVTTGLVVFRMSDDSYVAVQADLDVAPHIRLNGAVEGVVLTQPLKYHRKALDRAAVGQPAYSQVMLHNLFSSTGARVGFIVDETRVEDLKARLNAAAAQDKTAAR
jgi:hypothetical protein